MYLIREEGYSKNANNTNLGYTEYTDSATGFQSDANNNYLNFLDYIPNANLGYHRDAINIALGYTEYVIGGNTSVNYINTNDGRIDYLYRISYYSGAAIDQFAAVTWDTWIGNWELINTNWET